MDLALPGSPPDLETHEKLPARDPHPEDDFGGSHQKSRLIFLIFETCFVACGDALRNGNFNEFVAVF